METGRAASTWHKMSREEWCYHYRDHDPKQYCSSARKCAFISLTLGQLLTVNSPPAISSIALLWGRAVAKAHFTETSRCYQGETQPNAFVCFDNRMRSIWLLSCFSLSPDCGLRLTIRCMFHVVGNTLSWMSRRLKIAVEMSLMCLLISIEWISYLLVVLNGEAMDLCG